MTTGHINPGYRGIVTRFRSAHANPAGNRTRLVVDHNELENIKNKTRQVWSAKDNSETTYGHFHSEPKLSEKATLRPTSPNRRNNPHPHLVFLTTRLKKLPGYFNCQEKDKSSEFDNENVPDYLTTSMLNISRTPSVVLYPNANQFIQSLPRQEANSVQTEFKKAGIDTSKITENNTKPKIVYHYKVNPDLLNNSQIQNVHNDEINNSSNTFMPNMLNPYLYEDYRMYREKFANKNHGCTPNVFGKRPFRGDFSIHPDWPPRLKHHRLPYIY